MAESSLEHIPPHTPPQALLIKRKRKINQFRDEFKMNESIQILNLIDETYICNENTKHKKQMN